MARLSERRLRTIGETLSRIANASRPETEPDADADEQPPADAPSATVEDEVPVLAGSEQTSDPAGDASSEAATMAQLFAGCCIFISRECQRASLEFVIRACGGRCSWPATVVGGSTFAEDDASVTHQIVDRPGVPHVAASRFYVQPQWIYDCVNARKLLPVRDYAPGAVLPPHLSPFVVPREGEYNPLEEARAEENAASAPETAAAPDSDAEPAPPGTGDSAGRDDRASESMKRAGGSRRRKADPNDEKELAKFMMPRRKRQLYDKIQKARQKREIEVRCAWLVCAACTC